MQHANAFLPESSWVKNRKDTMVAYGEVIVKGRLRGRTMKKVRFAHYKAEGTMQQLPT